MKLRDFIIDWVQEGFQDFFRRLNDQFLLLSGKHLSINEHLGLTEGTQGEKCLVGLVLVLAQLSVFIEQSAMPRITEVRRHQIVIQCISLSYFIYQNYIPSYSQQYVQNLVSPLRK